MPKSAKPSEQDEARQDLQLHNSALKSVTIQIKPPPFCATHLHSSLY